VARRCIRPHVYQGFGPAVVQRHTFISRTEARIRHPNVASSTARIKDADQVGIWMEYIAGQTLVDIEDRIALDDRLCMTGDPER
jgi:hypothetical protein